MPDEQEYVINGERIASLAEFYDEFGRVVIPDYGPPSNLDAFDDILTGGFGTPDDGFTIRWMNSAQSRINLGYAETVRQLERRLTTCHPSSEDSVREELALARAGKGPTVFDWLIKIIGDHGPGGCAVNNNVCLILD